MVPLAPFFEKEEIVCFLCLCQCGYCRLDTSSYLTVLHSITEESVQQQVLQLSIPVERLFDFTQEDAGGWGGERAVLANSGDILHIRSQGVFHWITVECIKQISLPSFHSNCGYTLQILLTVIFDVGLCNVFPSLHKANQCHNYSFLIFLSDPILSHIFFYEDFSLCVNDFFMARHQDLQYAWLIPLYHLPS